MMSRFHLKARFSIALLATSATIAGMSMAANAQPQLTGMVNIRQPFQIAGCFLGICGKSRRSRTARHKYDKLNRITTSSNYLDVDEINTIPKVGMKTAIVRRYTFSGGPGLINVEGVSFLFKDPRQVYPYLQKDLKGAALVYGDNFQCHFDLSRPELNKPCRIPSRQLVNVIPQFIRVAPRHPQQPIGNLVKISGNVKLKDRGGVPGYLAFRKKPGYIQRTVQPAPSGGRGCLGGAFRCDPRNPWQ